MTISKRREPVQGVQYGSGNEQQNYFAPVTQYVFSGTFERLGDVCFDPAPLARDLDLVRFTGREWLIRQIDAFINDRPRGYVIIQAEAGMGKSTLAAHLVGTRPWLFHFTRLPGGRSPEAARKSLAAQLVAKWDLPEWAPGGILPVSASRPDWFSRLLEAAARKRDQSQFGQVDRAPIVVLVDGLDEAEAEPAVREWGLPLGLPENLPDGVYVVATSRFGIDRALHTVRNPVDWLLIEVEGASNLEDMRRFLQAVTSLEGGDSRIVTRLHDAGVNVGWFRANVAQACAGVWIYLRYVLDEIRDGTRNPDSVGDLPSDLAGFYAAQVGQWRGSAEDEMAQRRWEKIRLPLLGVLGAARTPLSVAELASFADVPSLEAARVFIEETARAFLSRRDGDPSGPPQYAVRHQSMRDMLAGNIARRPDLASTGRVLATQVEAAHRHITTTLTPPGKPGERNWDITEPYARYHLAAHAAACGELDALASDPGFLLTADPRAVLAQRMRLRTPDGKRALAAFDLSLHDWGASPITRIDRLAVSAARMRAAGLTAACANAGGDWPVCWAAWTGQGHRRLAGHDRAVNAVAIGRAGDRDVIVSGSADKTVRVWDAVTGELIGGPLADHDHAVNSVAIGRAGDRDVIVSGSADKTVRVWDAVTGELIGGPLADHDHAVNSVAIGRAGDRDVIVSGSDNGTLRIWDAITGELIGGQLADHDHAVNSVAIGRAGDRDVIVSGSADGKARVWDAITGKLIGWPLVTYGAVNAVAIGRVSAVLTGRPRDQDVIVSASADKKVWVWDAGTGALICGPLATYGGAVTAVAVGRAGDRDVIVSGSADGKARVWNAVTGGPLGGPLAALGGWMNAVAIGRAGDRDVIVSGSDNGTLRIWDAGTVELIGSPLAGHDGAVNSVAIKRAGDRKVIVSGSADGTVRVWDAVTGELIGGPLAAYGGAVNAVAIGRAGGRDVIVSGSARKARVWDAVTRAPLDGPLGRRGSWVTAVAVGRAGDRDVIVSGSDDGKVRVWDAVTGGPLGGPLAALGGWMNAVAIGRAPKGASKLTAELAARIRELDAAGVTLSQIAAATGVSTFSVRNALGRVPGGRTGGRDRRRQRRPGRGGR